MLLDLRSQMVDDGCIFVPKLLNDHQVARLRVICEHTLSQWRVKSPETGKAHIDEFDEKVMRHLNHPAYFVGRRPWLTELLDIIADPRVLDCVREVFQDEPLFRCTSLFFNPLSTTSDGNWHRDSQFITPTEEADRAMVESSAALVQKERKVSSIQMQIALVPSEDSEYVPGSHLRWDTEEEYRVRKADAMRNNRSNLMPGSVRTHQEPGDAAAFDPNGLHRGRYHADKYRRTLMLTYTAMSARRATDYFSDQPWCLQPDYLDGVQPATRAFFERFISEYKPFLTRARTK
jgi:hypothetical protein